MGSASRSPPCRLLQTAGGGIFVRSLPRTSQVNPKGGMNQWLRDQREVQREIRREAHPTVSDAPWRYFIHRIPIDERTYFCEKCALRKGGAEFRGFSDRDRDRLYQWCQECRLKYPWQVSRTYARGLLTKNAPGFEPSRDLIELKRVSIQLMRLRKNHEN